MTDTDSIGQDSEFANVILSSKQLVGPTAAIYLHCLL